MRIEPLTAAFGAEVLDVNLGKLVVIWDERCTAHFAVRDPWEGDRVLRRLLVEGDRPVATN